MTHIMVFHDLIHFSNFKSQFFCNPALFKPLFLCTILQEIVYSFLKPIFQNIENQKARSSSEPGFLINIYFGRSFD